MADPKTEQAKAHVGVTGELPSAINPPSGCRFRTRCPLAQEICAEVEPPLLPFGPGHQAACHFPLVAPAPDMAAAALPVAAGPAADGEREGPV